MLNIISNPTRKLLGLNPISTSWKISQTNQCSFFYGNNILHKVIYSIGEKGDNLLIEMDTTIQLDDASNLVSARGKTKTLNLANIKKENPKEPSLTIDFSKKSVLVECGVKWLPELSFSSIDTINNDIMRQVKNAYGEIVWKDTVNKLLKNPGTRQKYKDGDIFCIRLDAHQYVYALLIGSFMKLRKRDFWPSAQTGHYFRLLSCVPIILRKFNFVSDKNNLSFEEILKHELLNPEIIMDDLLLRGDFKIVAHKTLVEEDILMPMHYSCYGKYENSGIDTAFGMGVFDKENRDNTKSWLKSRLPYYKEINIVFNWGFGAVEMNAASFVGNEDSDADFLDRAGIGGMVAGLDENGTLINSNSIFNEEKLQSIFKTMNIECELNFDAFNKKYEGLTRKEYLNSIK